MLEIIDSLRSAYSVVGGVNSNITVMFTLVIVCVIGYGESFITNLAQLGAIDFFGQCSTHESIILSLNHN